MTDVVWRTTLIIIDILHGDMTKLGESLKSHSELPSTYDSIVCLGNSLPFLWYVWLQTTIKLVCTV